MILDTSALVAVVFKEPGFETILAKLADQPLLSVGSLFSKTDLVLA